MTSRRALILDLDGIVVDSEPLWNEAGMQVFDRLGVTMTSGEVAETMGMWIGDSGAYWYEKHPWEGASIDDVVRAWVEEVTRLVAERARPVPGIRELIATARGWGWGVAVASSSPLVYVQAVVDLFDLTPGLDAVHSGELEAYGKPHPAVFLTAADQVGAAPAGCVVIEDSPNGVLAAKAARMRCIAVPDPRLRQRREFLIADAVVARVADITPELLAGADS